MVVVFVEDFGEFVLEYCDGGVVVVFGSDVGVVDF